MTWCLSLPTIPRMPLIPIQTAHMKRMMRRNQAIRSAKCWTSTSIKTITTNIPPTQMNTCSIINPLFLKPMAITCRVQWVVISHLSSTSRRTWTHMKSYLCKRQEAKDLWTWICTAHSRILAKMTILWRAAMESLTTWISMEAIAMSSSISIYISSLLRITMQTMQKEEESTAKSLISSVNSKTRC